MAVTVYKSTDGSAPVLTGTAGDLVNLLDKCLVAGYGSQSGAGWSKPFTAANKAVFRQGGGNQMYLDVDDSAAATAKEARAKGYEVMTAVATGTNPFPTVAQSTNGLFIRKSTTADATARVWILIADDRSFYLFVLTADTAGTYFTFHFGDFYSMLVGDSYRTHIIARSTENSGLVSVENLDQISTTLAGTLFGHYQARSSVGTGTSRAFGKHGDRVKGSATTLTGTVPYPNPTDGGLYLSPLWITDPNSSPANAIRGRMRGFYQVLHDIANFNDLDTFTGVGDYAGKTFLLIKQGGNAGIYCIETSNTWETSS